MIGKKPVRVVLLWHMHQPDFRDFNTGEFTQPWVYLHAINGLANTGRGAIVLVPEIALTPQLLGRFKKRFGNRAADDSPARRRITMEGDAAGGIGAIAWSARTGTLR